MSSFIIKLIAIITMFADHLSYVIYGSTSWLNYVGRIAFPLFAWQLTIGFQKTRDVKQYIFRLFVMALISQPIYMLFLSQFTNSFSFNILFTLVLGLLCLCAWKKSKPLGLLALIVGSLVAEYCKFDYGSYGIFMIAIFYIFRNNNILMIFMQLVNLGIMYLAVPHSIQIWCIIAFFVILLYNNKRGKNMKYLFYAFYPLHLLFLYILNVFLVK